MIQPLKNKRILFGVTGSIAAYKAADLASKLAQAGAQVTTLLTKAGEEFVTPLTFQSVTGSPAHTDALLWGRQGHIVHINLAHQTDLLLIAPASANTLAKLARGIADSLLTVVTLAYGPGNAEHPLVLAPAMDGGMFAHPATQENLEILRQRGAVIIGPEIGHLASGLTAPGRMSEPLTIFGHIRYLLSRKGPLAGRRVIITAGGTQEPIDPVRVITNRSSGKQGTALAQAALDAGADVTLITTPVSVPPPYGVRLVAVTTAAEMENAVLATSQEADVLLMAAAVADFRPARAQEQKIKKGQGALALNLEPTNDILTSVAVQRSKSKRPIIVIGFAAETEDLVENAQAKLQAKQLDLIIANNVTAPDAGFSVDTNRVTLLRADGSRESLPLLTKAEVAERVIAEVASIFSRA
ncbi:MAG: bifunctional phosphopantothenoylcysteine decarboxylase/phosphopantothenate--cysteine ligase CoaBC [Anaerolineales bacterium]|nr:bifunctional phosphopantothenoylcysteine decarboxylase/phosphopantothenate--cysteine ligase CoaBC [Anaerolineales bacterium]